ncbi:MAG: sulfite exporter TauE/SafE family protein [Prolixibacteraceae bacterium]|nr:sulfite exporter TauE/SafE family protein [Prolixibacteraceae bacterium]
MDLTWLILIFVFVAFLYSSVGFGGGSSYLAFMAIFAIAPEVMKPIALICNVIVVSGSSYLYYKKKLLDLKDMVPLVVLSIPMAFVGGYLKISNSFFFMVLGASLVVSALLMFYEIFKTRMETVAHKPAAKKRLVGNSVTGGLVGFLSGMVGIGGGIFLSSILHLWKWDTPKKIAAASSFFILVNSISGLTGQLIKYHFQVDIKLLAPLALAVIVGGQIGSRLSIVFFKPWVVKLLTAILIFYVGNRILLLQLFGIKI